MKPLVLLSIVLLLYTLYDNVQVVVVNARGILRDSSEKALRQAVVTAGSGDQGAHDELGCTKSKFVCAILSENHFQLGVVKSPHPGYLQRRARVG